jgi:hypothetical protein
MQYGLHNRIFNPENAYAMRRYIYKAKGRFHAGNGPLFLTCLTSVSVLLQHTGKNLLVVSFAHGSADPVQQFVGYWGASEVLPPL